MWEVKETAKDGVTGVFGPFHTYKEAVESVAAAIYPWSEEYHEYLESVTIYKVEG